MSRKTIEERRHGALITVIRINSNRFETHYSDIPTHWQIRYSNRCWYRTQEEALRVGQGLIDSHHILYTLRRREIVDLDGIKVRYRHGPLKPGNFFVTKTNDGPKLFEVKAVEEPPECQCCAPFVNTIDDNSFPEDECVGVVKIAS